MTERQLSVKKQRGNGPQEAGKTLGRKPMSLAKFIQAFVLAHRRGVRNGQRAGRRSDRAQAFAFRAAAARLPQMGGRLDPEDRKGVGRPAEVRNLSERPTGRPAEPAIRRRAQRHHRHRLVPARRDAGPLSDDRTRQSAVHLAVRRRESAGDGQAHDRAGAEISRRRAPGPAHPVHERWRTRW